MLGPNATMLNTATEDIFLYPGANSSFCSISCLIFPLSILPPSCRGWQCSVVWCPLSVRQHTLYVSLHSYSAVFQFIQNREQISQIRSKLL